MGRITLCIFLLLAPMGGAFRGTEGVISGTQNTETPLDIVRVPDQLLVVTASDWAAPTENETTIGGATTAVPAESTDDNCIDTYVMFFLIFWVIIGFWYCYNRITPLLRIYPVRSRQLATKRANRSSLSDGEDVPSLNSHQANAPEDAQRIKGLFSKSWRQPVVASRRARSGRSKSPVVPSPPDDLLDLLYQDLA